MIRELVNSAIAEIMGYTYDPEGFDEDGFHYCWRKGPEWHVTVPDFCHPQFSWQFRDFILAQPWCASDLNFASSCSFSKMPSGRFYFEVRVLDVQTKRYRVYYDTKDTLDEAQTYALLKAYRKEQGLAEGAGDAKV